MQASYNVIFDMLRTKVALMSYANSTDLTQSAYSHSLTRLHVQDYMYAKRRHRSACAFAQSDQSLRYLPEDVMDPWVSTEWPAKTQVRLRSIFIKVEYSVFH